MEFLALYAGARPATARMIAITADEDIVERFAREMVSQPRQRDEDPVLDALEDGRHQALRMVANEAIKNGTALDEGHKKGPSLMDKESGLSCVPSKDDPYVLVYYD